MWTVTISNQVNTYLHILLKKQNSLFISNMKNKRKWILRFMSMGNPLETYDNITEDGLVVWMNLNILLVWLNNY